MGCNDISLQVPNTNLTLYPNCRIRLGRFQDTVWVVNYGWFSYGGNRPMCGWYLTNDANDIKPIFSTDLDDVYLVTY